MSYFEWGGTMSNQSTKQRIVETADQLFYQQGFELTSFAHIADALGISRGNFYHHFKTKDDILEAVIKRRLERTQSMLEHWVFEGESPTERIQSFINILQVNQSKIKRYGCPVGTLSIELAKLGHPSKDQANELFTLFRQWLTHQFHQLGHREQADEFALHLLMASQGVATLYNAFQDDVYLEQEVSRLTAWLNSLAVQVST